MKNQFAKYKDGTTLVAGPSPVPVDNSFTIIQANTFGAGEPATDLTTQTAVNQYFLGLFAQLRNTPIQFTANVQYYHSTVDDLGVYAPYLPADFVVRTHSAAGFGATQMDADAMAQGVARNAALELIAANALLFAPNTSGFPFTSGTSGVSNFSGINSQLLA
jgi:hypothetical protein